jgi:hypothetical protein
VGGVSEELGADGEEEELGGSIGMEELERVAIRDRMGPATLGFLVGEWIEWVLPVFTVLLPK